MTTFGPGDTVRVSLNDISGSHQEVDLALSDFVAGFNAPLEGVKRVKKDVTVSFTADQSVDLGINIPVGSNVVMAALLIETICVAGGDTVKIGLGLDPSGTVSDNPDKYGKTADLLANTNFKTLFDFAALSSAEDIFVAGVTTGGDLGTTVVDSGSVRVVIVWDEPLALS